MRRLEGHNIKKFIRKRSLKEEMSNATINKPEKARGLRPAKA